MIEQPTDAAGKKNKHRYSRKCRYDEFRVWHGIPP
jgi:hypothetical protein